MQTRLSQAATVACVSDLRPCLASDNWAGAHPAVMEAVAAANVGSSPAYGADVWTERAEHWFAEQFGADAKVFFVFGGTAANVVSLQAILRPHRALITSDCAHVGVDECGATERILGSKLLPLATREGKLTADQVRMACQDLHVPHQIHPGAVSLTQSTEYGTLYRPDELATITATARSQGLKVHMDGARIANAAAALGCSLKAITRDVGIDVLSFGATKNGAMAAEAVVVFDAEIAEELPFIRMQSLQLSSKMRFLAAQFIALGDEHRWLTCARHANAMAGRLAAGLADLPDVRITQPVQANAVFVVIPPEATRALQQHADFHVWDPNTGEVRLMTSWATTPEEIDRFLEIAHGALTLGG